MWIKALLIFGAIAAFVGGVIYLVAASTNVSDWAVLHLYDDKSASGPDRLVRIGGYCMLVTNYKQADKIFRKFLENHVDHRRAGEVQYLVAMCAKQISGLYGAKLEFQKVLDHHPGSPFAEKAREQIKKIDLVL